MASPQLKLVGDLTEAPKVDEVAETSVWLVNGHKALVIVWPLEAWSRLREKPVDAVPYPSGVHVALRMA